jgi:hypothetical protein
MKNKMQICWGSNLQTFTIKIYFVFLLIIIGLPQLALAQFKDDFSDDNFTASPAWAGDDSLFLVTNGQLMLNDINRDGVAYLTTPCKLAETASWRFRVSFGFNPSTNNYAQVFLISDQPDLSGSLNGYFVMIGHTADDVSLYKQTGTTLSKIIDGRDDLLNLSSVEVNIKVVRDPQGWQLFTDIGTSDGFTLEGTSVDSTFQRSEFFGIRCTYTATRSDKFFFDDFNIESGSLRDDVPPTLGGLKVISQRELELTFSEPLDAVAASTVENYVINHEIGHPASATAHADKLTVSLAFHKDFPLETPLVLSISGLKDLAQNPTSPIEENFIYAIPVEANPKDVIISEIFPDPSPSMGLPEEEFVEIYNRTEKTIDLERWSVTDESSTAILPRILLRPKEYLVLADETIIHSDFEKAIYLKDFPTLNNGNDVLLIKDDKGRTIDSINYDQTWYRDSDKAQGGWTLEIIDPENICSGQDNWGASEAGLGGTPGYINSISANKPDLTGPKLISALPINSSTIQLRFDERLATPLASSMTITIEPDISVSKVSFSNAALTGLVLSLAGEIKTGVIYSISILNLTDCAGNLIQEAGDDLKFGLPERADSLDILINEILFNPRPTGVDFVEIVNNSLKFINLRDWSVANFENGVLTNHVTLTSEDFLVPPEAYFAVTVDPEILKGEYLDSKEENFIQVRKLPPFDDDEGTVAVIDNRGKIVDFFEYNKGMHSSFIKDDDGVSLERISNSPSASSHNWRSASSAVGFASPGYVNSNKIETSSSQTEELIVEPEIFNPLSSQSNFALVHYRFNQGGYVANAKIYDSQGHPIKQIANNDLLGTQGFYRWDGDCDDGSKASIGYYMILFEVFDEHGSVRNYLRRIAIASSFD